MGCELNTVFGLKEKYTADYLVNSDKTFLSPGNATICPIVFLLFPSLHLTHTHTHRAF